MMVAKFKQGVLRLMPNEDAPKGMKVGFGERSLPVVFRRWEDGNVIALLPTIPYGNSPFECLACMPNGVIGAADPYYVMKTTHNLKLDDTLEHVNHVSNNIAAELLVYVDIRPWMHAERLKKAYDSKHHIIGKIINPGITFHKCACCGCETNGMYLNVHVCLECYKNGKLLQLIAENPNIIRPTKETY